MARARRDRDAIHAFVARDDPVRPYDVIAGIVTSINRLANFPALGRAGRKLGTRELVVPRLAYTVYYRGRANRIEILHIQHTAPGLTHTGG